MKDKIAEKMVARFWLCPTQDICDTCKQRIAKLSKELEAHYAQQLEKVVRATNISQIENWRDWIKADEELSWLVSEMEDAIESLKNEKLTDHTGVFRTRGTATTKEDRGDG